MPSAMETGDPKRLSVMKAVLRALLISNGKSDVTIGRLNGMYKEEEGEIIPFREFGYPNLQEFLRSMPDVMYLRYNREHQLCAYHVDTAESAHISSLVARQKKPQKRAAKYNVSYKPRGNSYAGNYYSNYSRPPAQSGTMSTLSTLRLILEELRKTPKYFQPHNGISKLDILRKFKERPGRSSITSLQTLNTKLKELSNHLVIEDDYVFFKEDIITSTVNTGSDSTQKSTKYLCQNLQVRSAPRPDLEINQQANGYKPAVNQPTPPHFGRVERPTETIQISFATHQTDQTRNMTLADIEQAREPNEAYYDNEVISERIKLRLRKLIKRYPEGISAAELPNIYLKEYGVELNYHELGFHSVTEFVAAVPQILTIVDLDQTGKHKILDAEIPLNKTERKQHTKTLASQGNFDDATDHDKEPVPIKLSPTVCQKFIPEGMMGLDDPVDHISVGSLANEDYFEVNISEIFTPSFFWLTLRKNKSKIKKLMDELDEFYKHQDLDICRVPQVLIGAGLHVACIYAKMWHRAIIKKVKPDGYAVVLFYDYGTVKTYSPNDLYYLHKKFSALPAQALACGLYNVKPAQGNEWSIPSTNMFVKKVWGIPLIASTCEVNEENNTMMITLTDTNESYDLHINDWMIDEGLAVHGKMEHIPSNKYDLITYGVPLHKLCMYDEDALKKRDEEYEACLMMTAGDKTSRIDNGYTETEQTHTNDADVVVNCNADSSFDKSSIFSLVQENVNLRKPTNAIAQAILSNKPINAQLDSRDMGASTLVKRNTCENESLAVSNSCSEDGKKTSSDYDRKLNVIKNSLSKVDGSCNRGSSPVSSNSFSSSYMQRIPNELPNDRTANQSLASTGETNYQNQVDQEYDRFSVSDGTPTYYNVKRDDASPKKSQKPVEHPPTFANTTIDHATVNTDMSEGYQTTVSSTHNSSNVSSNASLKSKSSSTAPLFAPIELSDRCFKKVIHIFHLDDEGWVPVNEFIDCFTNLRLERIMFKLLDTFNIKVDYKHLTRIEDALLFSQLDQSQIKAAREDSGRIQSDWVLILMPMKAMLLVLAKLEFVDPRVFKEASSLIRQQKQDAADVVFEKFNNKILFDALNLLIQYRQFRRLHAPH